MQYISKIYQLKEYSSLEFFLAKNVFILRKNCLTSFCLQRASILSTITILFLDQKGSNRINTFLAKNPTPIKKK